MPIDKIIYIYDCICPKKIDKNHFVDSGLEQGVPMNFQERMQFLKGRHPTDECLDRVMAGEAEEGDIEQAARDLLKSDGFDLEAVKQAADDADGVSSDADSVFHRAVELSEAEGAADSDQS